MEASSLDINEIVETKHLIDTVKHPNLKLVLQKYLKSLEDDEVKKVQKESKLKQEQESQAESSAVVGSNESIDKSVAATSSSSSSSSSSSLPAKRPLSTTRMFIPIEDYAWDQGDYNSPSVSIFIDLPGVGQVKQNCSIKFTKMGFDFSVTDLNGKNYRLIKDNLEKDIIPDSSSMIVKAHRVTLKLQKVKGEYSYESWNSLIAKKKRDITAEETKKKDPMGGIMDMMKDMYEDGDENMKKIIGEAMLKSQQGQSKDSTNTSKMGMMNDDDT